MTLMRKEKVHQPCSSFVSQQYILQYSNLFFKAKNIIVFNFQNKFRFLKRFIYLFIYFREGKRGRKRREKQHRLVAYCVPPSGDLARNPGNPCPRLGGEPATL